MSDSITSPTTMELAPFLNKLTKKIRKDIVVPAPLESSPHWTHPASLTNAPPTLPSLINLPSTTIEPALYAAAVDTIRITNLYLHHCGPYTAELTPTYRESISNNFTSKHAKKDPGVYMVPPDPRTPLMRACGPKPVGSSAP
ncbi:hypothetical protein CC86DRAFT_402653 [Ophiobolus disseminans]|uniref:Uncharacterized protein n=1 Tax=Ophiobolus disseminans TaxID=1469910 RepID=A0A6A7ABL7_9PLEO|nr:hypothetical protein CC86DRAFT_402653 [Ophiobolus disseminans]